MKQLIGLLIVCVLGSAVAAHDPHPARSIPPIGPPAPNGPSPPGVQSASDLFPWTGRWNAEFDNCVHQIHELNSDNSATVEAPANHWTSQGRIEPVGNSLIVTYQDDRTERWTPVGDRMVVEHWFPASRFPVTRPVLGIAERAE